MHILRPETIELVVIFAMIYEGTANLSDVNVRLAIFDGKGGEILIPLNSPEPRKVFCAAAKVTGDGNSLD
ncbi:MAG: tellurium resistance protein TerA, partial [Deltaproteobacteria bacterium]|nr:tellurium resistance protein TerA [Deltaproteobacteria bacterium]